MRITHQKGPLAALGVAMLLGVTACGNMLAVELPGRVTEDALTNPQTASALVNGVVLDFECGWTNYVTASNALSDQLINASSQGVSQAWYTRNILDTDPALLNNCEQATGLYPYATLQIARVSADRAYASVDGFPDALITNKALLKATVKAYGAYATLALGEGFCSAVLTPGSVQAPTAALTAAEAAFTEAITLATTANNTDLLNMARVGRARVRLDQGNFAGAKADAELVPAAYVKSATRGSGEKQRWNLVYEFQNNISVPASRHGSVAPNFRGLTVGTTPDPRPGVSATQNGTGNDGVTAFFSHNKAVARDAALPIASGKEAQLIVAEAAARSGDLATARTIINARHAAAGLPAFDAAGTATQNQMITQILEERSRELFLEVGARFNDMLRFRATSFKIPFRGEPGSIHPDGKDHRGLFYGPTTCIPIPLAEKS